MAHMSSAPWTLLPNEVLKRIFAPLSLADHASVRASSKSGKRAVEENASKMRVCASTAGFLAARSDFAAELMAAGISDLTILVDSDTDCAPLLGLLSAHGKSVTRVKLELASSAVIHAVAAMQSVTELIVEGWHPMVDADADSSQYSSQHSSQDEDDDDDALYYTYKDDEQDFEKFETPYETTSPLPDLVGLDSLAISHSTGIYLPLPWLSNIRRVCLDHVKDAWFAYSLMSSRSRWCTEELTVLHTRFWVTPMALDAGYPETASPGAKYEHNIRLREDEPILSVFEMMPWYTCRRVKFVSTSLAFDTGEYSIYLPYEFYWFSAHKLRGCLESLHVERSPDVLQVVMHHPELLEGARSLTLLNHEWHAKDHYGEDVLEDPKRFTFDMHWEIAGSTLEHLTLLGAFFYDEERSSMKHLDRLRTLTWTIPSEDWEYAESVLPSMVSLERLTLYLVDDGDCSEWYDEYVERMNRHLEHLEHLEQHTITCIDRKSPILSTANHK